MKAFKTIIKLVPSNHTSVVVWMLLLAFVSSTFIPQITGDEFNCLLELGENLEGDCEKKSKENKTEKEEYTHRFQQLSYTLVKKTVTFFEHIEHADSCINAVPSPPPKA